MKESYSTVWLVSPNQTEAELSIDTNAAAMSALPLLLLYYSQAQTKSVSLKYEPASALPPTSHLKRTIYP